MADSRAAAGFDRLPWLPDETSTTASRRPARHMLLWAVPAIVLVAALGYWIGARGWETGLGPRFDGAPAPRSTIGLPEARELQPEPDIARVPTPPIANPVTAPPMPRPTIKPVRRPSTGAAKAPAPPTKSVAPPVAADQPPALPKDPWPVRAVEGSSGRLVRIGAFSSRREAKRGWNALMRNNPSLQRLPALVVAAPSARDGKTYYRLQMGTTSQAHSSILCQRMRMIGQSCVIVADGAPGQAGNS